MGFFLSLSNTDFAFWDPAVKSFHLTKPGNQPKDFKWRRNSCFCGPPVPCLTRLVLLVTNNQKILKYDESFFIFLHQPNRFIFTQDILWGLGFWGGVWGFLNLFWGSWLCFVGAFFPLTLHPSSSPAVPCWLSKELYPCHRTEKLPKCQSFHLGTNAAL